MEEEWEGVQLPVRQQQDVESYTVAPFSLFPTNHRLLSLVLILSGSLPPLNFFIFNVICTA